MTTTTPSKWNGHRSGCTPCARVKPEGQPDFVGVHTDTHNPDADLSGIAL